VLFVLDSLTKVPGHNLASPVKGSYGYAPPQNITDDASFHDFPREDFDGPFVVLVANYNDPTEVGARIQYNNYALYSSQSQASGLHHSIVDREVYEIALSVIQKLPKSMCNPTHEKFINDVSKHLSKAAKQFANGAKELAPYIKQGLSIAEIVAEIMAAALI
jgi:hypothetical protein